MAKRRLTNVSPFRIGIVAKHVKLIVNHVQYSTKMLNANVPQYTLDTGS